MTTTNKPTDVVILTPEITKGMKSIGSKALLVSYSKMALIEYQIKYIRQYYPNSKITVLAGFEHDKIRKKIAKYNIRCSYNKDYEQNNQAASVLLFMKTHNPGSLLIINGGVLLRSPLNCSTTSIYTIKTNLDHHRFDIGIAENTSSKTIQYLFYGLPTKWIECIFLNKESLSLIIQLADKISMDNLFLFELINLLLEKNLAILNIPIQSTSVLKINNREDLDRMRYFYDKNLSTKAK